MPFRKNSYHIETNQAISKANKLTGFYMIQAFTKSYSQADCVFLRNSLRSPRQLKRILYKHGLFRSKSNLPFTTLCDIVQVRYIFAVFHSPHKVLIPETILTRRLIAKAKTIGSQITVC